MSNLTESGLWEHVQTRTDLQGYIDGAFADAMTRAMEQGEEYQASDYVAYSLNVQRKIREALLSRDAIVAGIDAVKVEKDWPYWDNNDIVAQIITAALDAVFGEGQGT